MLLGLRRESPLGPFLEGLMAKRAIGSMTMGSMMLVGAVLGAGCGPSVLPGAGGSGGSASGTGSPGTTSASSSSGAAAVADTAWTLTLQSGPTCIIATNTGDMGTLTESLITSRATDGIGGASVQCSVVGSGSGPYSVTALARQGQYTLDVSIASISTTASQTSPAVGSITYESVATAVPYSSDDCDFYFAAGTPETAAAGKIWMSFSCAEVTNGPSMSSCSLTEGIAAFEDCTTN